MSLPNARTLSCGGTIIICYDRIAITGNYVMFDSGCVCVCVCLKFLNFLFDMLMVTNNYYNVGGFSHIICAVTGMVREPKTFIAWVI